MEAVIRRTDGSGGRNMPLPAYQSGGVPRGRGCLNGVPVPGRSRLSIDRGVVVRDENEADRVCQICASRTGDFPVCSRLYPSEGVARAGAKA